MQLITIYMHMLCMYTIHTFTKYKCTCTCLLALITDLFLLYIFTNSNKSDPVVYSDPHDLQTNPAYGVVSNTKMMKGEDTYEICFQ